MKTIEFDNEKFIGIISAHRGDGRQKELADAMGVSPSVLSMYLSDHGKGKMRTPRADVLARLVSALNVPVSEFFTEPPTDAMTA